MNPLLKPIVFTSTILLAGSLALPAAAQPADATAYLAPQHYNDVSVVSGGVTIDEASAVKRMAPQYPLRVVISGRGGDYYIAQSLTVMQDGRVVAEIPDAGPWVLMDLPPGRYTLQGQFQGLQMTRDVTVTRAGTTLNWVVPSSLN